MDNLFKYKKNGGGTQGKSIAISAPTSAGKTFILKKYIIYKILESYLQNSSINIVFIVPSKALINELKADFIELFNEYKIKDKEICNIHTHISGDDFINDYKDKSNLFIFTQERLNFFYSSLEEKRYLKIDLTVVDEAHKVGYGYRGTLLSYIIGKIKKDNFDIQIVLLAPLLSKLNKFRKEFGLDNYLDEQFSNFGLVAKNEIIVSIEYKTKEQNYNIKYFLKINNEENFLFENIYSLEKYLPKKFTPKAKMSVIPRFFSNGDTQSIIFRFGAEVVIEQIKLLQEGIGNNKNITKTKLSNYLDDILPKDFGLSNLLDDGLSYHNGKLPISIKSSIESNFKNNKIKYLCANNTVLEGVNLPAKNIFISREEYRKEELSNLDIKNLIGRSGRLNHHLSGNIFFINFKDIEERKELLNENNTEKLENNITNILNDKEFDNNNETKFDRFLEYIKPGSKKYIEVISYNKNLINERKDFEYLLGYFVSNEIDKALNNKKSLSLENNNEGVFLNKDFFIDKISVYKNRKNTYEKDFYDKVGELIYENSDLKADKISTLREHILMLCNNELKIKNIDNNGEFDNNFLKIVQRNIFIDPRKQLNFYDLVISGKDGFLKYHMNDFNNNKLNIPKGLLQLLLISVKKYFINEYLHSIGGTYFSGDYYYKDKNEKYIFENNIFKILNQWRNSISLNNILKHRKKENYFKVLDNINSEIQFNYLNAFNIYFEIANLGYKRYIEENEIEEYDETKHKLDTNFIYHMELGTFFPNLIYLISKGVSRESAIWLTGEKNNKGETIREGIIKLFPLSNDMTGKEYFYLEKEKILNYLKKNKKYIIKDELEKFIY